MREIPDGVISMMVTPMHDNEQVNFPIFYEEMKWCSAQYARGVVVTPSIGEFANLTEEERMQCLETCAKYLTEELPHLFRIATIAATSTKGAKFYAQCAKDLDYEAGQINPPYYWVPDDEEVYRYYVEVAEVGLPIVVYNNPRLSKFDIKPKLMARLAKIPGVIAIKEVKTDRHVDLEPLFQEVKAANENVKMYTTFRVFTTGIALGSNGGFINVFAVPFCVEMWRLLKKTKMPYYYNKAERIQTLLNEVFPRGGEDNKRHIGTTKMAASVVTDINMGPPRAPYMLPDPKYKKELCEKLPELYELIK